MHALLGVNGITKAEQDKPADDTPLSTTFVFSHPCQHGTWDHGVTLVVGFGPNYDPPSAQAENLLSTSIVHCPGDAPNCAIICPGSGGGAEPAVRAREPR
jgi:hypothetical protein